MKSGRVAFGRMEAVCFGQPLEEAAAAEATRLGASRILVMASGTLNRETGEIDRLRRALGNRVAGVFDRMAPHTPRGDVIAAAEAARAAKADLIVTFGGGSLTDGAKAVRMCLANDIRTPEGMDALHEPARGPEIPQISIPTTLSAGEFSAIAGVTDERVRVKQLFRHEDAMPSAVILDPRPTVHTPEWLFLSTGVRAVDHCVEGVCAAEAHDWGDAQALRGLALLTSGLARVKAEPGDLEARLDCQTGAWLSMAPLASGVPMGASHGIGYVLGALFDVPHGHTSCVMLPAAMRWNRPANAGRQSLVAAAMGEAGREAGDALDAFIAGLDMPRSLAAVGVGAEHFERIAERAMDTPWVPRNPRPIAGPAEVMEILRLAA